MTVLIYDTKKHEIFSDSMLCSADIQDDYVPKIFEALVPSNFLVDNPHGITSVTAPEYEVWLIACAGTFALCFEFMQWLKGGALETMPKAMDLDYDYFHGNFVGYLFAPDGRAFMCAGPIFKLQPLIGRERFVTDGSGGIAALCALRIKDEGFDVTPEMAIRAVSKVDTGCGGNIVRGRFENNVPVIEVISYEEN